jgi:hypothetical protein
MHRQRLFVVADQFPDLPPVGHVKRKKTAVIIGIKAKVVHNEKCRNP